VHAVKRLTHGSGAIRGGNDGVETGVGNGEKMGLRSTPGKKGIGKELEEEKNRRKMWG
jgi:hypothetical protein